MNEANVRKYLEVIKRATQFIEQELSSCGTPEALMQIMNEPEAKVQPLIQNTPPVVDESMILARKKHVSDLLAIDCWPQAIEQYLVATNDKENQINRANAVLDMMLEKSIDKLNFLDFGCGDGWIARQALSRGANSSTGYDILQSPNWANIEKVQFTTKFQDLKPNHYDVIMLYDVLDHCIDPVGLMQQVKSLLKLGKSMICVRCHPWTSRHASHVYKQGLNKAYIHLFLTWDEISELLEDEQEPIFTRSEKNPIEAYRWWFHEFKIIKERIIKDEPLSKFFLVPSFKELIIQEQELKPEQVEEFFKMMEVQFIDFSLEK